MGGGSDLQRLSGGENCVLGPRRGVPSALHKLIARRRRGRAGSVERRGTGTATPSSRRSARDIVAPAAWENVGWDAAPRTEHAVLAAGEALEVAAAAHFCCVSWIFCVLIAPLRATSGQPPKLCAVLTACRQSQRETGLGRLIACERFDCCAQRSCNALLGRLSISAHENVHRACGVTASSSAPSVTGQE